VPAEYEAGPFILVEVFQPNPFGAVTAAIHGYRPTHEEPMPRVARTFLALGALLMMLAVICGAFAAHGLKARLGADEMAWWRTAVEYHAYHSLGLIAVGLIAVRMPGDRLVRAAGWSLSNGILLFSGSLYAMALGGPRSLGMVTPLGGALFIAGWALLALSVWRAR
jgi:uncharacterized membrane protein YgdD (TMEM256/DUF423 family)